MNFSANLRSLREKRKIRQEDVAREIGISTHGYQRYEYGEREPKLSILVALADYFDVSLDELVGRERFLNREKV